MTGDEVIAVANAEIGYIEKASNSMLDLKTANAGNKNYTKYGKAQGCNGQPWCDAFVDWCFIKAYGKAKAESLLGGFSNYTPTSAQYFKKMGQWHTSTDRPQAGDIVFFKNSTRICHTGIVIDCDGRKITTIEGNTSSSDGLNRDGGQVTKKTYSLSYSRIAGYGRPAYSSGVKTNGNVAKSNALDYSLVFDYVYYHTRYNDLRAAYGTDKEKLLNHFIKYGMKERRQAIDTFNVDIYKASNPDLVIAFGNNYPAYYTHYMEYGHKEGRKAH